MHLYETRRRAVVPFRPPGPVVRMYTCGITPYDATHIGHAATFVAYDVLQRRLRDLGYDTRCVRNVTDVDDDILERAGSLGVHYLDLAAAALNTFEQDMEALDLLPAHSEPRATSAMSEIRSLIGRVLASGHAYQAGGGVLFAVDSADGFGTLSGLSREQMLGRLDPSPGDELAQHRRNPLDFVLWQPSRPGEPEWSSPWGPGRPGWHVECTALALRELGSGIDLHGGGSDLVFPHHECEAVQAEAATGELFVRHWMHSGTVFQDGQKMSKSLGNLTFVSDLRTRWDPMAIRLAIVTSHYRADWSWSDSLLASSASRLARWRAAGDGDDAVADVRTALDDDLDTPAAVAAIDAAAARGGRVSEAARLLGISW